MDPLVLAAMQPYFSTDFYNPSSPYAPAVTVRHALDDARHRLAQVLGGKRDEIVITAGATESINLAMTAAGDGHIVTTAIEHDAVLEAAKQHTHSLVMPGSDGIVSPDAIAAAVTDKTQLVSVALANHEIGTVQPLSDIAARLAAIRQQRRRAGNQTPLWLHTDASQGVGQIDINVARRGVDMMTINAGKIYGPKQVALLWARPGVRLSPLVYGGGQERGLRSGTENVSGIIGFATALELADKRRSSEAKRLATLRDKLERVLVATFPEMILTGSRKRRLPGHLHVSFPGLDAERLVFLLEARGVLVATGSACAANKGTRSHVLTALGCTPDVADGSLRLTLGHLTDEDVIERAAEHLVAVIKQEQARIAR